MFRHQGVTLICSWGPPKVEMCSDSVLGVTSRRINKSMEAKIVMFFLPSKSENTEDVMSEVLLYMTFMYITNI